MSEPRCVIPERYFYEDSDHYSPFVDPKRPGEVWVDIQIDEAVIAKCPDCRVFIYYKCVIDECRVSNADLPATYNVIIVLVITLIPSQLFTNQIEGMLSTIVKQYFSEHLNKLLQIIN